MAACTLHAEPSLSISPIKADHELYSTCRYGYSTTGILCFKIHTQTLWVFRNQVPTYTHGYSGTRYLIPVGYQAQPGTARHSQAQTSVHSSYGKLLVHNMIYYAIYQIYSTTYCSIQLHICSRCAYIMSTFLIWHICIINQLYCKS